MTFKVGDKVRRINCAWNVVNVGDVDVVEHFDVQRHGVGGLFLVGRTGSYLPKNFEKVEEMNTRRQWADLIIAWANGAQIQFRMLGRDYVGEWTDVKNPAWDGYGQRVEYRIKPEPKPDVVKYACVNKEGNLHLGYSYDTLTTGLNVKATFDGETGKLKAVEILA